MLVNRLPASWSRVRAFEPALETTEVKDLPAGRDHFGTNDVAKDLEAHREEYATACSGTLTSWR